jgi:DNA-binding CsgD family transcriptional regulator/tetratricopeptide (TPR) repeat protein
MGSRTVTESSLLEREREVATLDAFVGEVGRPGARLGLIGGPAGIGKTSLLAESRRLAESEGIRILAARGSELEREFAYGVVRQLFEPALADPDTRKRAFEGGAEAARAVFEAPAAGDGHSSGDVGFAGLHGLYWLTLNLAGDEPLVLAVDDLHWCDQGSLRFIAYLVHRLEELPILVIAATRPNEPGADEALLAELAHDPLTVSIQPGALSADAVAALIERRLGEAPDAAFADACHSSTGGNPLLLHELLRALVAEAVAPTARNVEIVSDLGPRAVSRAVLLRLMRLPDEAAKLARAIAVLGEGAALATATALAGLDERQAADASGALARAEILRPDTPLGFVHPLVRDAIYLDLSPGEREIQHKNAADLLRESNAAPEQVAAHVLAAPGLHGDWVTDTLTQAAAASLTRGAPGNAVPYLRRALEGPVEPGRRAAVLATLGRAEMHSSGQDAVLHLGQAYEQLTDPPERAALANSLAWVLMFTRRHHEAKALAARAAAEAPPELDDLRHGLLAFELMSGYIGGNHDDPARFEPYWDGLEIRGGGAAMLAAGAAFDRACMLGPREQCVALARRALAEPGLFEHDHGLFWCGATLVLAFAEEPDAITAWHRIGAEVYRGGSPFGVMTVRLWAGYVELRWGRLDEGWTQFESAAEGGALWGAGERIDRVPAAFIAQIQLERGDVAGARGALESSTSELILGSYDGGLWQQAEIELLTAERKLDEALERALALGETVGRMDNPAVFPWRTLAAEVLGRLGREDEGLALAAEELERARAWGAPGPMGRALRVIGALEGEDGLEHLREAADVLEGSPAALERARALCELGTRLRLSREGSEAREPLQRALELATVGGATVLAERARTELHATGARPRREALKGIGALTASERRVADLAAEGRTNREIAQELFVTPKTVEVHLSSTYRKLGIDGRRELAASLL